MAFNERLKMLLNARNIGWKQVSQELSIGKNQPKYWEDNNTLPDGKTLIKLSQFFNVSVDYLLGLEADSAASAAAPSEPADAAVDDLDQMERVILEAYRQADAAGKARIIQFILNERDAAQGEEYRLVYRAAHSTNNEEQHFELMSVRDLEKLKNAPKVTSEKDL